jgi:hypothetical protein
MISDLFRPVLGWLRANTPVRMKADNANSKRVHCGQHGSTRPAFVCGHLRTGTRLGWNEPEHYVDDPENPFALCINAWCDCCESLRQEHGGWDDESERAAEITMVCENCALEHKSRNEK